MSTELQPNSGNRTGPYRPADRLVKKAQFDAVFDSGLRFRYEEITLRALPNGLTHSRLGMLVGKRCGGAVRRNRMKRLLREVYRRNRTLLSVACDLVIVPGRGWHDLSLSSIEPVFREALSRVEKAVARSQGDD